MKVRRLSVPVRAMLALRPSELEAGGGGLGGRRGFRFVSPPLLRVSDTFMEPRLPITVCVSSSVSSSSVLKPDAELTNALANVNTPPFSLPRDRQKIKKSSARSALSVFGRNRGVNVANDSKIRGECDWALGENENSPRGTRLITRAPI